MLEIDDFRALEDCNETKQLPSSLKRLMDQLNCGNTASPDPAEILTALVFYATSEMGFVPTTFPIECRLKLPTHWAYRFAAQVPFYVNETIAKEIIAQRIELNDKTRSFNTFKLTLANFAIDDITLISQKIFNATTILVSLTADSKTTTKSVILDANDYVVWNPSTNQIELINVARFVEKVKHELIEPIRNDLLLSEGYPHAALDGLSKEALSTVFKYLRHNLCDLQALSQASVFLRNMAIEYLGEKNIQLKHRQPTPIVYDSGSHRRPPLTQWHPHFNYYTRLPY